MPGLAKVMEGCTLVRSLGHSISAHGPGTIYMATGNRPGPSLEYPAAGALAARLLPQRKGIPPYVTFTALQTVPRASDPVTSARRTVRSRSRATRSRGHSSPAGCRSPSGFTPRDLRSREALRDRFDRGLWTLIPRR